MNLNKTRTLSSVPSNSSSEVPLLPARSLSSKNLAINSAGRFCHVKKKDNSQLTANHTHNKTHMKVKNKTQVADQEAQVRHFTSSLS